ncbi:MAG: hypothetical protein GX793_00935 [Bacteroidales bacterium]|jgi:hypothetical protein|nr:hypothetical protein [Bacteroidales bacterium]MCK9498053.1 hypothetical protein [Bacteroidales bacterium]MDY0314287.1 hypothetical protein [Bacteroidales bacterium]NLB85605.1 hypothetical protein [Bacteroidales bacterium]
MRTITLTKSILVIALISTAMIFSSCKRKKEVGGKKATEIIIPCKDEGRSDKKFFRADANASSQDMSLSREKALLAAKQRVSSLINSQIKSVTDRYVNETEVGQNSNFEAKFENLTREVVNQTLVDIAITCEKNFQEANGKYTTYIAVEVSKDAMINGIEKGLSKDQKLQVDYDKMKFEQIFNEEMDKLSKESGY